MIAVPAIDIRGGRCVQLRAGDPADERVSLADPIAVARRWWKAGFSSLHIVDLDAALGSGDNDDLIDELVSSTAADTQVGGGIRSKARVEALFSAGADRVIVGTRALEEAGWLNGVSRAYPKQVVLAADVKDGKVLRRGWQESTDLTAHELFSETRRLPLAGVLCTDVSREGRMEGIASWTVRPLIQTCPHPLWVSGGITTLQDLRTLKGWGAKGAVLGMALYTDTIDHAAVAREFGG